VLARRSGDASFISISYDCSAWVPLPNTAPGNLDLDCNVKGDNDPRNVRTPPSVSSTLSIVDLHHHARASARDDACRSHDP